MRQFPGNTVIIKLKFLILAKKTLNCRTTSAGMCFDIQFSFVLDFLSRKAIDQKLNCQMNGFVNISASADYRGFGQTRFEKPRLLSKRNSGDPHALATENIFKK